VRDATTAEGEGGSSFARRMLGFATHGLTASGAAFALLALIAAADRNWPLMFIWLGIALVVDGVDGSIARAVDVARVLPRWSGDSLDFVVDFVTYVFVPAYAVAHSDLMPASAAIPAGIVIVMSGALYFADRDMKMTDNCFRGFPALWNVVAFYLLLVRPDPWLGFAVVLALALLTFARFPFVHPLRVARLRPLNVALLVVWLLLAAAALGRNLQPGPWITVALCAIALYFACVGLVPRRR
jgi:phosphatidylcholine synthase